MEFINIKQNKMYYLLDMQDKKMWEDGYLAVCGLGEKVIYWAKMEDLMPIYTDELLGFVPGDVEDVNVVSDQA